MLKVTHLRFEKSRLRQISAYNVSTIRDSEKVQVRQIGSRPRAFQRAIDGVRVLPLSPQRVAQKAIFLILFLNKIQFQSNKVCNKVSFCENSQRQSNSITIPQRSIDVGAKHNLST